MSRILKAIEILSDLDAKDLDNDSVQGLCQLMYKMKQVEAMIFVKTVGRLDVEMNRNKDYTTDKLYDLKIDIERHDHD